MLKEVNSLLTAFVSLDEGVGQPASPVPIHMVVKNTTLPHANPTITPQSSEKKNQQDVIVEEKQQQQQASATQASTSSVLPPEPPQPQQDIPTTTTTATTTMRENPVFATTTTTAPAPPLPPQPQQPQLTQPSEAYTAAYQAAYQAALQAIVSSSSSSSSLPIPPGHQPAVALVPSFFLPQQGQPMMTMMMPAQMAGFQFQQNDLRHRHPHPAPHQQQQPAQQAQNQGRGRVPEHIARLARALNERGVPLPPDLMGALGAANPHQDDNNNNNRNQQPPQPQPQPQARGFQLRIQINMRAVLQVAVLLVVVYQHCPPRRFALLCLLGFVLWLSTTPRVRAFLQMLAGMNQARHVEERVAGGDGAEQEQQQQQHDNGDDALPRPREEEQEDVEVEDEEHEDGGYDDDDDNDNDQQPIQQHRGWIQEIHAFVAGFLTSLLPAMDPLQAGDNQNNNNNGQMRDVFAGGAD